MTYRNDHQAALNRAAVLEEELAGLRDQQTADQSRIEQLERQLTTYRNVLAQHGVSPELLPSNALKVLIFGILGLAVCPIFGPFAWYMGRQELRQIDAGRADATKRGLAQAGMVLGIVATIFVAVFVVMVFCGIMAQLAMVSG